MQKGRALEASAWYGLRMKRDWTDAEFVVVQPRRKRRRLWFDWRNFAIVGGLTLIGVLRALIPGTQ